MKKSVKVLVIDAQGGGLGRSLVQGIKKAMPKAYVLAVGTNTTAAAAMLKAGADSAATGENSVVVCSKQADIIAGPIGILMADSMHGEITKKMAVAVGRSPAAKVLIPTDKCETYVAGSGGRSMQELVDDAVIHIVESCAVKEFCTQG